MRSVLAEMVQNAVKEKHGFQSQVGWSINNGTVFTSRVRSAYLRKRSIWEMVVITSLIVLAGIAVIAGMVGR